LANVTVNAFALLIAAEAGVDTANTNFIAQIERFINDGMKHILNFCDWPWRNTSESINTVSGTATIAPAITACEITAIRIPALDCELEQTTIEALAEADLNVEITGRPRYFYNLGYDVSTLKPTIGLYPVPDAIYALTVYETLRAVDVASATNIPFPEDVRGCLREIVRYYMEKADKDYTGAALAKADYVETLKRLRNKYLVANAENLEGQYTDVPANAKKRGRFPGFSGNYPI
jgi:hypothetical protein